MFFASQGISDNSDLMRCQLLCLEAIKDGMTLELLKDSTGYRSCLYDIPDHLLTDEKLTEMLTFFDKEK